MERITSARDLFRYLAERFRRDGCFPGGVKVDKGELILPIGPELDRFCEMAKRLRQSCDRGATSSSGALDDFEALADFAVIATMLNHSDADWHELSDVAISAERKADRARQRALKRSRRNTKNPKKKGKRR